MRIFVLIVLAISFAMHFYVFWRLFGLLGWRRRWGFWLLTLTASVALVGSRILEAYFDHILVDAAFVGSAYALGLMWLAFCVLLAYEVMRWCVPHRKRTAGISIVAVVAVLAGYATWNATRITVKTVTLPGPPMRIVQLSDVHICSVSDAHFGRIIEHTNRLNPDMICITGDLVDTLSTRTRQTMQRLSELKAPVFFTSGNHEYYAGRWEVLDELRRLNVTIMDNRVVNLCSAQLVGLPDMTDKQQAEAELLMMPIDRRQFVILMFHRPLDIGFLEERGIDLTMVGHTHRGQIFPFGLIVRLFESPLYGLHRCGDSAMYITSGTGLWGPRMRLGTNNEIVLYEIAPDNPFSTD